MSTTAQPPVRNEYLEVHLKRFELSLAVLKPRITPAMRVLETGGSGDFTGLFAAAIGVRPEPTTTDLRYGLPIDDASYDVVLSMEVLEHLHDVPPTEFGRIPHSWEGTGTATHLAEAFRVLRPGGLLFLTTPNLCSLRSIQALIAGAPAGLYRPHVREYTPREVRTMVEAAGFRIETLETLDPWPGGITPPQAQRIRALIEQHGGPTVLRDGDIFLLARKPSSQ